MPWHGGWEGKETAWEDLDTENILDNYCEESAVKLEISFSFFFSFPLCLCVCVCVYVCERQRENERGRERVERVT